MDINKWVRWHCPSCIGKHGILTDITPDNEWKVKARLEKMFGENCSWSIQKKNRISIEFVDKNGSPEVARPWGICGSTVLFDHWRDEEIENTRKLAFFNDGDMVSHAYAGRHIMGTVTGKTSGRLVVYMVSNKMVYYLKPEDVHLIKRAAEDY